MKLLPQDITPELLFSCLRSMAVEDRTPASDALTVRLCESMGTQDCVEYVDSLMLHVAEKIPSCNDTGLCFCQMQAMLKLGMVIGVHLANNNTENKMLDRMAREFISE